MLRSCRFPAARTSNHRNQPQSKSPEELLSPAGYKLQASMHHAGARCDAAGRQQAWQKPEGPATILINRRKALIPSIIMPLPHAADFVCITEFSSATSSSIPAGRQAGNCLFKHRANRSRANKHSCCRQRDRPPRCLQVRAPAQVHCSSPRHSSFTGQ